MWLTFQMILPLRKLLMLASCANEEVCCLQIRSQFSPKAGHFFLSNGCMAQRRSLSGRSPFCQHFTQSWAHRLAKLQLPSTRTHCQESTNKFMVSEETSTLRRQEGIFLLRLLSLMFLRVMPVQKLKLKMTLKAIERAHYFELERSL